MYTDPNWLLSTVVQSAAAFVAIVAGFIISRLLALSAERNGLQAKLRDRELQLVIKQQNLDDLEEQLLNWDAQDFLEDTDVLDMIVESEGEIPLTDAMKCVSNCFRSEDELRPYWDEAIEVTKTAFHNVKERFEELDRSDNLSVELRNLGVKPIKYHLNIYYRVMDHIKSEINKKHNPFGEMVNSFASISLPDSYAAADNQEYRTLMQNIDKLIQEKNALDIQLSDLRDQLKHLGQPKGIRLGIIFLAYFSLVGIVVPVFLLPLTLEKFTLIYKWGISLFFFSGLLFFFIYLFILIRQLGNTNDLDNQI